jgi:flagellar biogenesis protein FliO
VSAETRTVGKSLVAVGGCLAALALAQAASPASSGSTPGAGTATRLLAVLGLFCGAAFLLWKKLARGPVGPRAERALQVIEKTTLGPRHGLALIEADGARVLVAFGEGFVQVLPLDAPQSRSGSGS